ncbi:hypothetical protein FRC12_004327 [Ceratobasidium sp. 428]|nr:hypothetical protein FRC12_004327 [Ceratobasidium sp. 428]
MADSPSQPASADLTYLCRSLTVPDIVSFVAKSAPDHRPTRIKVNKFTTRNKKKLLQALLEDDPYWGEELQKIAVDNVEQRRRSKRDVWRQCAKRTRDTKRQQAEEEQSRGEFLELPSDAERLRSYAGWHNATSNEALEQRICAVCARLRLAVEAQFTRTKVTDLPNRHRLVPHAPHPDHFLVQGCLLEPNGCHGSQCDPLVEVCKQCLDALQSPKDLPPKFSLANNLWLGEIPWELARLTFAEHLLIARNFPRMFLINLFPRDRTTRNLPRDQVQTGL